MKPGTSLERKNKNQHQKEIRQVLCKKKNSRIRKKSIAEITCSRVIVGQSQYHFPGDPEKIPLPSLTPSFHWSFRAGSGVGRPRKGRASLEGRLLTVDQVRIDIKGSRSVEE